MATIPSVPFTRRSPNDIVVRDGVKFFRGELDRDIKEPDLLFSSLTNYTGVDGVITADTGTHPENTPSVIAAKVIRAAGQVAIADIGCGTANTLWTWGKRASKLAVCDLGMVSMTGIKQARLR